MKEIKEEIPFKFWKEYEETDVFDRKKKIQGIVKNILRIQEIPEKMKKEVLERELVDYFNDVINYMDSK